MKDETEHAPAEREGEPATATGRLIAACDALRDAIEGSITVKNILSPQVPAFYEALDTVGRYTPQAGAEAEILRKAVEEALESPPDELENSLRQALGRIDAVDSLQFSADIHAHIKSRVFALGTLNAVHGTTFDVDSYDPESSEPPKWWVVKREHCKEQIRRLEFDSDRLTAELEMKGYSLWSVLHMALDLQLALGRVHGILGRLPGPCVLPTETHDKLTTAASGALTKLREAVR